MTMHTFDLPVRFETRAWRRLASVALVAAAALAGAGAHAQAQEDPPGRVGRVAEVTGNVRTINAEGAWADVVRNEPFTTGDRVTTDKTGRATLQVGSTVIRLGADADVTLTQLDDQRIRLKFDRGQMVVRVRSDDIPGELFIDTEEGAWVPHHPGQYRFDRPGTGQLLAAQTISGDMLLEAHDSSLPVAAPQRAQVWLTGPRQVTAYKMVPPVKDAFGDAVLAADKQDDASSAANAKAQVPAEMTGAAELSRFGTWSVAADGTHLWTPAKLPAGWQPFQQGAWWWSARWGWTWVDDQPWGFAPSHYGRWLQAKGHWAWTPGQWGAARPVYAPATVGWFGGPSLSVDGAPATGWIALAPDELLFPGYAVSPKYWNALNDASVGPTGRRAVAVAGRARLVPAGALAYANRAAAGAESVVATSSLAPQVPVPQMQAVRGAALRKPAFVEAMAKAALQGPPPQPSGRGALAAGAAVVQVPVVAVKR